MSMGWTIAAIGIPTAVCGIAVLLLCWSGRCDHTMYPSLHEGSGRIFWVCRCGERFQR